MRRSASTPPELPGYTFVRLLGSGGFSDVFLYDQKLPKRRVAVKVLLTEEITVASRAAFVAEANLMAQLSTHPYIVTIYQADVASDDRPYFVMEYCSGPSLAESYKQHAFAVADALRTGVRVSSAVATAHAAGILHRDIKPANVLTNDYGWPALTDFGISSAVEEEALPIHTGTLADALHDTGTGSQSVGMSVPWSPPEMFEDDPQPDVRSDVFSLAATIYTILAGHTPFEVRGRSNGTLDLIGRIERGAITPMSRDDIPRSLLAVLQKGMASDRNDRFATAVDFARALQRVELELGYAPTTIDVPNLLVEAPDRETTAGDADETRARTVATIEAQPVAPAAPRFGGPGIDMPPPGAPSGASMPGSPVPGSQDETQVRNPQRVIAQPDGAAHSELPSETVVRKRVQPAPAPTAPDDEPHEKPSRTNRVVIIVSSIVAVVIAAAIVGGIVIFGSSSKQLANPDATPTSSAGTGESAIVKTAPTPVAGADPVLSGSTLTFSAVNPEPEKGDTFIWRISNMGDSAPTHNSQVGTAVVDGYAGSTVCVQFRIVRKSQDSANPLETCYPKPLTQ